MAPCNYHSLLYNQNQNNAYTLSKSLALHNTEVYIYKCTLCMLFHEHIACREIYIYCYYCLTFFLKKNKKQHRSHTHKHIIDCHWGMEGSTAYHNPFEKGHPPKITRKVGRPWAKGLLGRWSTRKTQRATTKILTIGRVSTVLVTVDMRPIWHVSYETRV